MSDYADERWRAVPGFEGYYDVSSHGNIRSYVRRGPKPWLRGPSDDSRPVAGYIDPEKGYKWVQLCIDGERSTHLVHRLMLMAFIGDPHLDERAVFMDGSPSNLHIENLRWNGDL